MTSPGLFGLGNALSPLSWKLETPDAPGEGKAGGRERDYHKEKLSDSFRIQNLKYNAVQKGLSRQKVNNDFSFSTFTGV